MRFNPRTDLAIINAGDFVKVGRKHFRHVSGREIKFDYMKSGWRVSDDQGWVYPNLHSAASRVRYRSAQAAGQEYPAS